MHIMVCWDISAEGDRWGVINKSLLEGIQTFSWVKPLTTTYIIRVNGEQDRQNIQSELLLKAEAFSENVFFLITPVMPPGQYQGYLPKSLWADIGKRTGL